MSWREFYIKLHLSDTYNRSKSKNLTMSKLMSTSTGKYSCSVHDVFMCSMFLQVAAAEVVVWGASRAARCSWLSKSSMDLSHSLSLLWPCWRHLVSTRFFEILAFIFTDLWVLSRTGLSSSTMIPRMICASCTEAHLSSQWLNSCSPHSFDLSANSTDS